jgi:hypothetical protein
MARRGHLPLKAGAAPGTLGQNRQSARRVERSPGRIKKRPDRGVWGRGRGRVVSDLTSVHTFAAAKIAVAVGVTALRAGTAALALDSGLSLRRTHAGRHGPWQLRARHLASERCPRRDRHQPLADIR